MKTIRELEDNGYEIITIYKGNILPGINGGSLGYDEPVGKGVKVFNDVRKLLDKYGTTPLLDLTKQENRISNIGFGARLKDGEIFLDYVRNGVSQVFIEIGITPEPDRNSVWGKHSGFKIKFGKKVEVTNV